MHTVRMVLAEQSGARPTDAACRFYELSRMICAHHAHNYQIVGDRRERTNERTNKPRTNKIHTVVVLVSWIEKKKKPKQMSRRFSWPRAMVRPVRLRDVKGTKACRDDQLSLIAVYSTVKPVRVFASHRGERTWNYLAPSYGSLQTYFRWERKTSDDRVVKGRPPFVRLLPICAKNTVLR